MWERSFRRVRQDCDSHHFFQNIFQCWVPFFFFKGTFPHSHPWRLWRVETCIFTLLSQG